MDQIHSPHEHASVSLKTILLVFAVILVGALGYFVWDYQNTPDTTDYSTPKITKKTETTTETETVDETKDWVKFSNTSNFLDVEKHHTYSFLHPSDWVVKKIDSDERQASLTYKYNDNDYSLLFIIGSRGYTDYNSTVTEVLLGEKKFKKSVLTKEGEDTIIIYSKPDNEEYLFPLDMIMTTIPSDLVSILTTEYEKVIATFSAK